MCCLHSIEAEIVLATCRAIFCDDGGSHHHDRFLTTLGESAENRSPSANFRSCSRLLFFPISRTTIRSLHTDILSNFPDLRFGSTLVGSAEVSSSFAGDHRSSIKLVFRFQLVATYSRVISDCFVMGARSVPSHRSAADALEGVHEV
jgi:hypothetical protein